MGGRAWTEAEIEILKANRAMPRAELAALLPGRTVGTVRERMSALGLTKREPRGRHGHSKRRGSPQSITYSSWASMNDRCRNEGHKDFHNYGGRGITICDRWGGRDGFVAFLSDMGERPSPRHTLDRISNDGNYEPGISNDGNYEPGNCRWALPKEQGRNRRDNVRLTFRGETRTVAEWVEITGLRWQTIGRRLDLGWPVEQALTRPCRVTRQPARRA